MPDQTSTVRGAAAIIAPLDEVAGRTHLLRVAAGREWEWADEYVAKVLGTVGTLYDELDATRREMARFAVHETAMTKREICRQLGITRRTLDHWITRWEQEADADTPTPSPQ